MRKTFIGIGLFVVLLLSACSSSSDVRSAKQTEKQAKNTQSVGSESTKFLTTIEYPQTEE